MATEGGQRSREGKDLLLIGHACMRTQLELSGKCIRFGTVAYKPVTIGILKALYLLAFYSGTETGNLFPLRWNINTLHIRWQINIIYR